MRSPGADRPSITQSGCTEAITIRATVVIRKLCCAHCRPLENGNRCFNGLNQFDLQVLLCLLLISRPRTGTPSTGTPSRSKTHYVNSWKGTAGFRWPQLLDPSNNNSA
ncbi:unnamed protein product [Pleuronectes platessa]|uniref:Uncharacterized protein n=1 Tax=Pleuronectes platessa TaxID=8262 RepID=A0A9N7VK34_PLEPL|nr:unnamed protein product [Pleuronectes platessa]